MSDPTFKNIVDTLCKVERWIGPDAAFIECPGIHKHTTATHYGHTKVWIEDNQVRLKCFHASCQIERGKLYGELARAWELYGEALPPEVIEANRLEREQIERMKDRYAAIGKNLINTHPWPESEIRRDSPPLPANQWHGFLDLFEPKDILWTGEPAHTGQIHHINYFKTAHDWRFQCPRGRYSCPATFVKGSISRSLMNVQRTPYLVVEGDALLGIAETPAQKQANKDACGAVSRYLQTEFGLTLVAVVDTGNKSLHSWFQRPADELYEQLRFIIPALGCDRALMNPTQPVRLPGMRRGPNEAMQELVYYVKPEQAA